MAYGTLNAGAITPGSGNTLTVSEAVTFSGAVTMQSANNQGFAAGTKMLFNQTAAPTGWTKVTSSNDVALRLTSGTVGTGGSVAFETAFASQTITTHGLTTSELPNLSHTHKIPKESSSTPATYFYTNVKAATYSEFVNATLTQATALGNASGATAHGHGSVDLNVSYVDVIIATKD